MGLWHARLLRAVGRRLQSEGHQVTYAVANPVETWSILKNEGARLVQAPVATPLSRSTGNEFQARAFADILHEAGFHAPETLGGLVGAWDGLIDAIRPDLVVCDHAPSLLVASHQRLPAVQLGLGFSQPPSDLSPWPAFGPGEGGSRFEPDVLATVNEILRARGVKLLDTLGGLYATHASHVTTFAEFDPYSAHRRGPFVGPLDDLPSPLNRPAHDSYFAYLSADVPESIHLLRTLASLPYAGQVFLRGAHPHLTNELRALGLNLLDEPADMLSVLKRHRLLIHHGGVGTSEQAAAAGRAQLVLPWHLEQAYNAAVLEQLGLGLNVRRSENLSEAMNSLLSSEAMEKGVRSFAELAHARRNSSASDIVMESCRIHL